LLLALIAKKAEPSPKAAIYARRMSIARVAVTALAGALALPLAAGGAPLQRRVPMVVVVRGDGAVRISASGGTRTCRTRCVWRLARGSSVRLTAQSAMGSRFVGWQRACSARASCTIKVVASRTVTARFRHLPLDVSWSAHVACRPVVTTLPEILGSEQNERGGATEAGGRFQPHLRGPAQQHLLDPPCTVDGTPAFVTVEDVVISKAPTRSADGDDSANLTQAGRPDITSPYMKTIRMEIDNTWITGGVAPPPWPRRVGTKLDVQGFVFWDPGHVDSAGHAFSGWELHPVAAWRTSG
jgi:hypothetical protein